MFQGEIAKPLELLSPEQFLWKPTQLTATNKPGAPSTKQKEQPCVNVTCLANQRPDAQHLAVWQGKVSLLHLQPHGVSHPGHGTELRSRGDWGTFKECWDFILVIFFKMVSFFSL